MIVEVTRLKLTEIIRFIFQNLNLTLVSVVLNGDSENVLFLKKNIKQTAVTNITRQRMLLKLSFMNLTFRMLQHGYFYNRSLFDIFTQVEMA